MASKLFGSVPEVEWVEPTAEEFAAIDEMYWVLVRTGKGNAELHEGFTRIAKRLCAEEDAECILFAGTDLAVLFNESNTDFPYLDCGETHLQAILQAIL
jgi:aspartate/glutamate racemase